MNKAKAIELLGGSAAAAAKTLGITVQAVYQWEDPLQSAVADRVQAALWRQDQAAKRARKRKPAKAA